MARTRGYTRPKDTAAATLWSVFAGGGLFDNTTPRQNKKGWDIFELGQKSFWAVPTACAWDEPVREDPEYAEAIAAMLGFLLPGEKAAVTGASYISTLVRTEEAKFYFAEQALEEAKHYDALRRLVPKITGRPLDAPRPLVRMLYTFGVLDRDDVAVMMGNINVIGEHLANQIFHQINHVAKDPNVKKILALIGKDESRHIAAGQRFFPEVYPEFRRRRARILAKNLATTLLLCSASYELVHPMKHLSIDLATVMDRMYEHYQEVCDGLPAFPEQGVRDAILELLKRGTPQVIRNIERYTLVDGTVDKDRLVRDCARAVASPRALREMLAA